ncbi:uncharacterized protein A4U43_C07F8800 [Asparagus officinalis]|uniref:Uncharacterized protein n=1 Tax=Asparagus officinalis TaxID=4686 RepID=A0A5P1EAS0_ASPOF|nr:uncharacterized protein A4U43_C07F8800 [Asparagus officinalis]
MGIPPTQFALNRLPTTEPLPRSPEPAGSHESSSDSSYRPPHHSLPTSSSRIPDSMAHRIDILEEGVYERLRDLERRQEEIHDVVIGRVDGLKRQLDSILSLLQPSNPSPDLGPSSS